MKRSNCPSFKSLTFEDAVKLFKQWGFQVEPGPRPEEVTLIIQAPDHKTFCVYPADMLTQLAAAGLSARWRNGTLLNAAPWQAAPSQSAPRQPEEKLDVRSSVSRPLWAAPVRVH